MISIMISSTHVRSILAHYYILIKTNMIIFYNDYVSSFSR